MGPTRNQRQFRINPVELAIFSAISLLFVYSVYHLFYDHQGFQVSVLSQTSPPPIPLTSEGGRSPASVAPMFLSVAVKCSDTLPEQQTTASKVRLAGPLCGALAGEAPVEPKIENQTNRIPATVFLDQTSRKFSTDYIPLNPGKNSIWITYPGNSKKKTYLLEITKI